MSKNEQEEISDIEEVEGDEFVDEDFGEEDWEEGDGGNPEDAGANASPVKKKSSKFNLILILCAVLGGGGFLYTKMGGSAPAPVPAATEQPVPQEVAEAPPQPSPPVEAATEQKKEEGFSGGFLNNPESFDKVEEIRENMQFEEYVEGKDTEEWPEEEKKAGAQKGTAVKQEPLTPLPAMPEQSAAPVTADILPVPTVKQPGATPPAFPTAQDVMIPAAAAVTAQSQPASSPQQAGGGDLQKSVEALGEQLADIGQRLDDLEGAVGGLEVPSISGKEIADLKTALVKLEKKVDGLAAPAATSRKSADNAAPAAAQPKEQAATGWILKSAQPGKAIVGKTGQNETYAVAVGDRLEGMGKIMSIEQQNGLWVVQGSAGKITQ